MSLFFFCGLADVGGLCPHARPKGKTKQFLCSRIWLTDHYVYKQAQGVDNSFVPFSWLWICKYLTGYINMPRRTAPRAFWLTKVQFYISIRMCHSLLNMNYIDTQVHMQMRIFITTLSSACVQAKSRAIRKILCTLKKIKVWSKRPRYICRSQCKIPFHRIATVYCTL